MENKDLIILTVLIVIIGTGLTLQERNYSEKMSQVLIETDKAEYKKGEFLKVAVKNNSGKRICFSSCYPYYLEVKDSGWKSYLYSECREANINEICVSGRQTKFFEINLSFVGEGAHRLAVPVCLDCKDRENFREDSKLYSNEFLILSEGLTLQ